MKWTEGQIVRLKELCDQGVDNKGIAVFFGCKLSDVYNKRSALGITIDKCKGIAPNPEFEKALEPVKPKGMTKCVRDAFAELDNALLLAIGSDRTSLEDANQYYALASALDELKDEYNARIGRTEVCFDKSSNPL